MKFTKNGSFAKLVAFFLIAIALLCTVGFASDGWQSIVDFEPDSGENGNNKPDDAVENIDGISPDNNGENNDDLPVADPTPKYFDYLTGLEISQEESFTKYCCFVESTDTPLYGASSGSLLIEIPTENGKTRYLIYKRDALQTGKIGSVSESRAYINYVASKFDCLLFYNGIDDSFSYNIPSYKAEALDFSQTLGYSYTEYTSYVYTNGDLVNAFIKNSGANTLKTVETTLPFNFNEEAVTLSGITAETVIIPFSDSNSSELFYNKATNKYVLYKNGEIKHDFLYDKSLEYDNAFLLFADSVTYETADATELVVNTFTSGKGYYICGGVAVEIEWRTEADGELVFYLANGEKLTVNKGTSYIGYAKSSLTAQVKFS